MNALQIGLIAIGALVVALLFLWHWWQSRKSLRAIKAERAAEHLRIAPRMQTGAQTGASAGNSHRSTSNETSAPSHIDPIVDVDAAAIWTPQTGLSPSPQVALDTEPDFAVVLSPQPPAAEMSRTPQSGLVEAPIVPVPPRPKLISQWPFDERLHVHGSVVSLSGGPFDAAPFVAAAGRALAWVRLFRQSPWEMFDPANVGSVQQLALALPLASRAGPIEPEDMDAWRFVLTELAHAQGCEAHFHGFRDGPERATELDSFLAAVDIIPVAYLVKKEGGHWLGTRLRGTLEANGFRLQSDGRFAYHEVESDAVIFHTVDGFERPFTPERLRTENFTALRCTLEPVRLAHPMARFDMYRQSLRALAKLLDADLKTSEGDVLDDSQFAATRDEVKTAMDALVNAGIEPGSDTARSLFC